MEPSPPDERASDAVCDSCAKRAEGPDSGGDGLLKAVPDQIARFVEAPFTPLGTDGFGRSDTRAALRRHFEVDAGHIVVAVLAEPRRNW